MGLYNIKIKHGAEKEIKGFLKQDVVLIIKKIKILSSNPRPNGCEKLKGNIYYRVRHGDYRIVYEVDDSLKLVHIIKVGHRREIYKRI
jgi:mRNA interferase RelE/StbE